MHGSPTVLVPQFDGFGHYGIGVLLWHLYKEKRIIQIIICIVKYNLEENTKNIKDFPVPVYLACQAEI